MGTSYRYDADNFEEILSRLENDEAGLASESNFVDSENGLGDFNFSDLEGINFNELNCNCSNGGRTTSDDVDAATLGLNETSRNNDNECCSSGVINARECYERGLRQGLEQGFVQGFNRGRQQRQDAALREGYNAGLEKGLSRAQELARASYQNGYRCGYQKGYRAGYQRGYQDGCNAGFERGAREGFARGYQKALNDVKRCVNNCERNTNNISAATNSLNNNYVNENCGSNSSWRTC